MGRLHTFSWNHDLLKMIGETTTNYLKHLGGVGTFLCATLFPTALNTQVFWQINIKVHLSDKYSCSYFGLFVRSLNHRMILKNIDTSQIKLKRQSLCASGHRISLMNLALAANKGHKDQFFKPMKQSCNTKKIAIFCWFINKSGKGFLMIHPYLFHLNWQDPFWLSHIGTLYRIK